MKARLFILLLAGVVLAGCTNPLANLSLQKKSGLQVTSIPQATVFLDGNSLGTTPVREENLKPGEHTLKLVPQDPNLQAYETKVKLTPGVLTAVDRTLAAGPTDANGFTLSFEALSNKRDVIVDITTVPESVTISVDNTPQGFTPKSIDTITAGDHVILFSSPGYIDKTVRAKALAGHRLTIAVQLAKAPTPALPTPEATPSGELVSSPTPSPSSVAKTTPTKTPTPTPTPTPTTAGSTVTKPYVEILATDSTGGPCGAKTWLNVRNEPRGEVLAQVCEGDTFPYVASNPTNCPNNQCWHKIEYETGKEGWVSSQFAKWVK